jgi:hypothetical protein
MVAALPATGRLKGYQAPRDSSGYCRKLRAYPPQQVSSVWACSPCNPPRRKRPNPRPHRQRNLHHPGIADGLTSQKHLSVEALDPATGTKKTFSVIANLRSDVEITYYQHGGVLHYVLRTQFLN